MNTERALGTFFNEINKAIDVSKKPVKDVINYYLSSSWKSFESSWFLNSVANIMTYMALLCYCKAAFHLQFRGRTYRIKQYYHLLQNIYSSPYSKPLFSS
jgi:7,8-dihydro-6-hydroxymethylpterin-pyrophosphokinase